MGFLKEKYVEERSTFVPYGFLNEENYILLLFPRSY